MDPVPQDYVQAHKWFNLAAAATDKDGFFAERGAEEREFVASQMTPAQIAEAHRLASVWQKK